MWPRWDGLDGFGKKALNWEAYLSTVQYEDSPAGLFELEALAYRLHIRAVVCRPTTQQLLWVGEPERPQMMLLYWHSHWTLLPLQTLDPGHR
eukprot:11911127-Prorocentrum_lima.AAC.1